MTKKRIQITCKECSRIRPHVAFGLCSACYTRRRYKPRPARAPSQLTHGESKTRLHRIWRGMRSRCSNRKDPGYKYYGAKGIRVCAAWLSSFESFRDWSLSHGYAKTLSIDRFPDKKGNYAPSNCRWATAVAQNQNKTDTHDLTAFGETKCLNEWARDTRCSVNGPTIGKRLSSGLSPEEAITKASLRSRA